MPFIIFLLFFIASLTVIALLGLAAAMWLNARANRAPEAVEFAKGLLPEPPDGFWQGNRHKGFGGWRGKRFDRRLATGINVFESGERYPFRQITGPGLTNKALRVLKIDYNRPGNPLVLRPIVDEVVTTTPGQLLGKIQLRLGRNEALTLGYFRLSAPTQD